MDENVKDSASEQESGTQSEEKETPKPGEEAPKSQESADVQKQEPEEEKSGGSKKKMLIIMIVAVLVIAGGVTAFLLMGGKKEEAPVVETIAPPDSYQSEHAAIPAVTVSEGAQVSFDAPTEAATEEEKPEETTASPEESQETVDASAPTETIQPAEPEDHLILEGTYHYKNMAELSNTAEQYCKLLTGKSFGFTPIDQNETEIPLPDTFEQNGHVRLALPVSHVSAEGTLAYLFVIDLQWQGTDLSVGLGKIQGAIQQPPKPEEPKRPEPITAFEATRIFSNCKPSELNLPGDNMRMYQVILMDGSVMAGDDVCLRVNLYETSSVTHTNVIAGMYLLSADGERIYKVSDGGHVRLLHFDRPLR